MLNKHLKIELGKTYTLALPIIISQLGVILMSTVDNVMVGRLLGATSLGAAGIANSLAFLISSLAIGGMAIIAPMVSKFLAEKNTVKLAALFSNTLLVAFLLSVVLSLVGYFLLKYFYILGQKPVIEELAIPFFLLILISNVPLIFFLAIKQFSDGYSKPKIVMYITFFGLLFNIMGNSVLISGWGIFPSLGLNGAAYATIISRTLMVLLLILYLRNATTFKYLFKIKNWTIDLHLISELNRRIIPSGFQTFFEIAAFTFAVIMMGWLSETDLAAHQIAINVASTTYMMATGFAQAGGIRIGEAWGLQDKRGITNAGKAAYIWVIGFMGICTLLILLFGSVIIRIYIDNEAVLTAALPLLMVAAFFQLSDGMQSVGLGVLRGLADIKVPTYITFVAYWILALPLGYYLAFNTSMHAVGIWVGLLIGLTFSAAFLYARFKRVRNKRIEELPDDVRLSKVAF